MMILIIMYNGENDSFDKEDMTKMIMIVMITATIILKDMSLCVMTKMGMIMCIMRIILAMITAMIMATILMITTFLRAIIIMIIDPKIDYLGSMGKGDFESEGYFFGRQPTIHMYTAGTYCFNYISAVFGGFWRCIYPFCLRTWVTWWRHQMETFSALLAICAGNSPVPGDFPRTKASDAELWCFLWYAPE